MKVREIYNYLDSVAPFNTAAEWDNTGLSVGSLDSDVRKVLVSLDVTSAVIEKAIETGSDLVLTHHPLIFSPVSEIEKGSVLYNAVKSGITFVSSHTCLDKAEGGVNDTLAENVEIKNLRVSEIDEFLKIGETEPCSVKAFAEKIKASLGGAVAYTDNGRVIKTVALCSGSGGDLVSAAALEGADALLTGEVKHHEYLLANELGVSVFSAGHYETENIICEKLKALLKDKFNELEVEIYSESPVKYI